MSNQSDLTIVQALRGEFAHINPSRLASPTSTNPISVAHFAMIKELARMQPAKISVSGAPEDFEDVADYIVRLAATFDRLLLAVGESVKENALCQVDLNDFTGVVADAIQGNATFDIDQAAQAAQEAQDEDADTDYRYDELRAE
jgi:hypothetical protein